MASLAAMRAGRRVGDGGGTGVRILEIVAGVAPELMLRSAGVGGTMVVGAANLLDESSRCRSC